MSERIKMVGDGGQPRPRLDDVSAALLKDAAQAILEKAGNQREAAKLLGIQQSAFSRIVNGKSEPTIATLVRMADALATTTDELLGRSILARRRAV